MVIGCVNGMDNGVGGQVKNSVINLSSGLNPDGNVTIVTASGIAWDGYQHYMATSGTSWIKLGSVE